MPVGLNDLMLEAHDVAGRRHLALHFVPQPLELGNRRQRLRAREPAQERFAIGVLRADDRLFHDVRGVAGDLPRNAEEFTEVAFALFQQLVDRVDLFFVVVELGGQRRAARFGSRLGFFRIGQHARLLGAVRGEFLDPLRIGFGFRRADVLHLIEQFVERDCGGGRRRELRTEECSSEYRQAAFREDH